MDPDKASEIPGQGLHSYSKRHPLQIREEGMFTEITSSKQYQAVIILWKDFDAAITGKDTVITSNPCNLHN